MARKGVHSVTCDWRTAKVFRDSVWGEYVVRLYEHGQLIAESDYFTDDRQDAINTAAKMVNIA